MMKTIEHATCASLLLIALTMSSAALADGRAALQNFYQQTHSLTAHFDQTQRDDRGQVTQRASGMFYLQRPKQFRWVYQKPYKQIILSNGKVFKFYDVGLKQVTVRSIGTTLRATPALLLTGGAALKKAFKITDGGTHDGADWVVLTPKTDNPQFKKIRLGLKNGVPQVMKLKDALGQSTKIKFDHVNLNASIAAKRFRLSVPDGVDVVDARGSGSASASGNSQ